MFLSKFRVQFVFPLVGFAVSMGLAPRSYALDVPQPQKNLPKVTANFSGASEFKVSYGQKGTLCVQATPASRTDKLQLASVNSAVFELAKLPENEPGCSGASWEARSKILQCHEAGDISAQINADPVSTLPGKVIVPKSEKAVFKGDGGGLNPGCDSPGVGCYFRNYNVLFEGPPGEALVLQGLSVFESLTRQQVPGADPCPFVINDPLPQEAALDPGGSGLWGVGDHLEIPSGSVSGECIDRYVQSVAVEGCPVQDNILTFKADVFGNREITRSDEVSP